jgi:uncharacterized membrane protein YjgN (DUF898 family)
MVNQKTTPVVFTGNTKEYFGIWIVNLLLTLATFGIYSAWAKVRRKKYFFGNTLIDYVGFDYHAKPAAILKGRIIAFALFMAYSLSQHVNPKLPGLILLLFFIALPWLVVRASIFNARNTSYRGLRFDFVGKTSEAVRTFIVMPIITVFTLRLGAPYSTHQKNKFLVDKHRFGLSQFDMKARVIDFYNVYLKLSGSFLIGLILVAFLVTFGKNLLPTPNLDTPAAVGQVDEQAMQKVEFAKTGNEAIAANANDVDTKNDKADAKSKQEKLRQIMQNPQLRIAAFAGVFAYAMFIFGIMSYVQAHIGNLVWNTTTLDKLSFKSELRARDFMWLYFSNLVAIMLTFGLATPWAQVRMAKYRASKLQVIGDVDFDQFVGDKKAETKAAGEEIADMFELDLSFG